MGDVETILRRQKHLPFSMYTDVAAIMQKKISVLATVASKMIVTEPGSSLATSAG